VIKLDSATNGEYFPRAASVELVRARKLAADNTIENARRLGLSRRAFLASASGAATGLLALNRAFAAQPPAGTFQVPPTAALDVDEALSVLGGRELIVDVQTHYVDPAGPWRKNPSSSWNVVLRVFPQARCDDEGLLARVFGSIDCFASLQKNGIGPNQNVYAELGSTWRNLMRNPTSAAHALGKLFKHVGEDRLLWGTDCIWYGSPQDQIAAFRAFQIAPEAREKYGYPEITPKLRAKVFGLNAATPYQLSLEDIKRHASNDWVSRARAAYAEARAPSLTSYGPRTRREMLDHWRLHGDRP
jgi:hypothetical protein